MPVSVSKVSGLIFVSKAKGLSHKPIALRLLLLQLHGFGSVCNSVCFLSAVSAGKKQQKQVRKMLQIPKYFKFKVMLTLFQKFLEKFCYNSQLLKSQIMVSKFRS